MTVIALLAKTKFLPNATVDSATVDSATVHLANIIYHGWQMTGLIQHIHLHCYQNLS